MVASRNPVPGVIDVFNMSESPFSAEGISVGPLCVSCPLGFSLDFLWEIVVNLSVEKYVLSDAFFTEDDFD